MRYEVGNADYLRSRMTRARFILSKIKDGQRQQLQAAERRMADAQSPLEVIEAFSDVLRWTPRNRSIVPAIGDAGQRLLEIDQQSNR